MGIICLLTIPVYAPIIGFCQWGIGKPVPRCVWVCSRLSMFMINWEYFTNARIHLLYTASILFQELMKNQEWKYKTQHNVPVQRFAFSHFAYLWMNYCSSPHASWWRFLVHLWSCLYKHVEYYTRDQICLPVTFSNSKIHHVIRSVLWPFPWKDGKGLVFVAGRMRWRLSWHQTSGCVRTCKEHKALKDKSFFTKSYISTSATHHTSFCDPTFSSQEYPLHFNKHKHRCFDFY